MAVTAGLTNPYLARLVDRYGQGRILVPAAVAHGAGLGALLLLVVLKAPAWTYFLSAIVLAVPRLQIGSLIRARWSYVLGQAGVRTAYAFESVVDEATFIAGPLLVTALAVGIQPASGVLLVMVLVVVGSTLLAAQRATEPPPQPKPAGDTSGPLGLRGMPVLLAGSCGVGSVLEAINVTVVAYTKVRGVSGAAGWVLALWATASFVTAIGYGDFESSAAPERQYLLIMTAFAFGTPLLLLPDSVFWLALVLLLVGLTLSPAIIVAFAEVARLVPAGQLTEGLTWVNAGFTLSAALATAAAGQLIDAFGARAGFWVAALGGAGCAVAAWAGYPWLRTAEQGSS